MDFTIDKYCQLLDALQQSGMSFKLRHDVDRLPANSLRTAQLEKERNIAATYYFRCVPESYNPDIIKQIAKLGHEIGYHYESLTTRKGNLEEAFLDFCRNLEVLRSLAPVHTICMHGSPRSPWDSRDLWKHFDYHSLGIDYEPYLDTDFSDKLYLTDTGRRWDGYHVSLRDKIPQYQDQWDRQGLSFHTTDQIIAQLLDPDSTLHRTGYTLLITTHPQRWNPFGMRYLTELGTQTLKNVVKHYLIRKKTNH